MPSACASKSQEAGDLVNVSKETCDRLCEDISLPRCSKLAKHVSSACLHTLAQFCLPADYFAFLQLHLLAKAQLTARRESRSVKMVNNNGQLTLRRFYTKRRGESSYILKWL